MMRRFPIGLARNLLTLGLLGAAVAFVYAQDASTKKVAKVDPMTQDGQNALEEAKLGRQHQPSELIFPKQNLTVRFSHQVHMKEDLTCVECHDGDTMGGPGIVKSIRSSDLNLPIEETCFNCHDVEDGAEADPPAACSTCHPGYEPEFPEGVDRTETKKAKTFPVQTTIPNPHLKMNHKAHIELGIACTTCHGTMKEVDLATVANSLPTMGECVACHDGKTHEFTKKGKKVEVVAPSDCATCHMTNPDGRVKTDLPGGHLAPKGWYFGDAHDEQWLKNHANVSKADDTACQNCHEPKYCLDCHNGVTKPLKIHPNDWILTHAVAARKSNPDCNSCHKSQSFCVDCHTSMGVGGDDGIYGRTSKKLKFHPEGWAYDRTSTDHHSWQAQRNIRACASCHTEASCLQCHASGNVGGYGFNPHPPGFKGSNCRRMKQMNPRVCVKCHLPDSAQYRCE
jgi:hypothetical protein